MKSATRALAGVAVLWVSGANVAHGAPVSTSITVLEQQRGETLCPDEGRRIAIELRNDGETTWDPRLRDRLAYHVRDASGEVVVFDGRRTLLPHAVSPGQTVELQAAVVAPSSPGRYLLQWAMVREQVRWSSTDEEASTWFEVVGEGPAFAWVLESTGETHVAAGDATRVTVRLRNVGCATWSAQYEDALSYHWLDAKGQLVESEGTRTPLPRTPPGAGAVVEAELAGPPTPGAHILRWEPVREHIAWYGPPKEGDDRIAVDVAPPKRGWSLLAAPLPDRLAARQVVTVPVTLHNEGTETWSASTGDRLAYHWLGPDGEVVQEEGLRTELPEPVEPGTTTTVQARLAGPHLPGTYRLVWEMVRDGVAWYGRPARGPWNGTAPEVSIEAPHLAWELIELDAPHTFWVGRTSEVRLRVRNVGSQTWSQDTQDHVSYRWIAEDGEVLATEGLRTELPHDVAPGETVDAWVQVQGLDRAGSYVLELDLVREHVAWFGPPEAGGLARAEVSMRWLSTALGVGLALVVAAWVVFDRRVAHRWPTARAALRPAAWPSWIAGMIWVLSEAFADLSGVELWEGARLVAMSSGAVLALMVIAVPSRFRAAAALGLALLLTALVVADLAYIDFFGSLVPLAALAAMHHLMDASGTVVALLRPAFAWLLVLPATGVLLVWLGRADTDCVPLRVLRMSHWGVVVVAALLSIPALTAVGTATFGELGRRVFSEAHNAGRLGVVGAHLFQIGRGLRSLAGPGALGETDANRVRTFFHQRAEQPAGGPHFGAAQGMNAVLIQVEALQGWVIGARVEGQEITPFLNRATADAAYFSRIYDQTAQGRTSDAEYLVLASGHPLAEGALCFLRQDNGFVTVAHALRQRGYATLSAHPYRRGFWNRAALHPRYGFEQSIFRKELGPGPVVGWGLADGPFLQRTAERLTTLPRPFFAFLITLSLHHPYDAFPVAMRELDLGALENTRVGNYLHAMHHFDGALEAFFGALEQRGLGDETLVMIYGDHVAGLGEPPEVLELAGLPRWDPSVPTRLRTIPAFAWVPRASLGGRIERVGGHVDLGATLLHLLGVRAPPSFVGRVLVEPGPGFAPLPEGSGVGDDRMLVRDGAGPIAGQCFDLPAGTLRPRADCDALAQEVDQELELSRMVLDYDLYDAL